MNPPPLPYQTIMLGSTTNFTVLYETIDRANNAAYPDVSVVVRRAQAVLDGCERDYAILCDWFGIAQGHRFGPSNKVKITLTTYDNDKGGVLLGAVNYGMEKPLRIFANPCVTGCFAGRSTVPDDDVICALVVSELSEIVMASTGTAFGWNRRNSSGEGLSRVTAHLLHPYFVGSFFDAAPTDIEFWMSEPPTNSLGWFGTATSLPSHNAFRQDWVSQDFKGEDGVHGDVDWFSFGCAILFIYYLKDQLRYSMSQIVQTKGDKLEDRYFALTGKKNGFAPFLALLNAFYPANTPRADLPFTTYDLFPLGGTNCRIGLSAAAIFLAPPFVVRSGVAETGTMCGPREFGYTLFDLNDALVVTAKVFGFAHPLVSWTINGVDIAQLMAPGGGSVTAVVVPEDPTLATLPTLQVVHVKVTVGPKASYPDMSTLMTVSVEGNPGQVQLQIGAAVTDRFATAPENTATGNFTATLATQKNVWVHSYQAVVEECWNRYITTHNRPLPWLRRYMPDPEPDLLATAKILENLAVEIRELAARDPRLAKQVDEALGGYFLSGRLSAK